MNGSFAEQMVKKVYLSISAVPVQTSDWQREFKHTVIFSNIQHISENWKCPLKLRKKYNLRILNLKKS